MRKFYKICAAGPAVFLLAALPLRGEAGPAVPGMVFVPMGQFLMGSDKKARDERPRRRVNLAAYYFDKWPVTNAAFRRFGKPEKDFGSKFNGKRNPVVGVNWIQAGDYCKSMKKRLPTEAEWEKAAGGPKGLVYPWGTSWNSAKLIWGKSSFNRTHPVDRKYGNHRSPYGAVDMVENVFEWVQDRYAKNYYKTAPKRNPKGASAGKVRVLRGGAWDVNSRSALRTSFRFRGLETKVADNIGFRCARDAG